MARARAWCFTLNRRGEEPLPPVWTALPAGTKYLVFQKEKGECEHYQGYVCFTQAVIMNTVKTRLGCDWVHLEAAKGSAAQNKTYCTKEETRLEGPWELGEPPKQGQRSDVDRAVSTVKKRGWSAVVEEHPSVVVKFPNGLQKVAQHWAKKRRLEKGYSPPKILVLWGAPDTGKSLLARAMPGSWWKKPQLANDWWDGYEGEKRIILDDFYGQIPYHELLDLLDGHEKQVAYKGGFLWLENTEWVITSNRDPRTWYAGVVDKSALWDRLWHRFDHCIWEMGTGDTACPCHVVPGCHPPDIVAAGQPANNFGM